MSDPSPEGGPAGGSRAKPSLIDAGRGALRDPRSPLAWVSTTYFAEGFPYTVVNTVAEALFKEFGASLKEIGLTALFHLPWNLKFLWGPFLDAFATKRAWLVWTEIAITAVLVALALSATSGAVLTTAGILFMLLAVLSATHDIAIDGFYLEGLDEKAQSTYVGLRAAAYRAAMFVVSSPLLIAVGSIQSRTGRPDVAWAVGMLGAAGLMGLILAYHARFLPRVEAPGRPLSDLMGGLVTLRTGAITLGLVLGILGIRALWGADPVREGWAALVTAYPLGKLGPADWIGLTLLAALAALLVSLPILKRRLERADPYAAAYLDFLDQPKVGAILAFIVLFRLGESFLLKMRYAFLRDIGMSVAEFGAATGTFGLFASMGATLAGGWLIGRYGLRRCIWPFVLAQNTLNLLYMYLAWRANAAAASAALPPSFTEMTAVITAEAIGSGLGTAVFMVYIMRCCRPAHKAAHMAILTALMSLGFTVAGVASGYLADALGFTAYFGLTFVATVPGMLMIFAIPYLDGTSAAAPEPRKQ